MVPTSSRSSQNPPSPWTTFQKLCCRTRKFIRRVRKRFFLLTLQVPLKCPIKGDYFLHLRYLGTMTSFDTISIQALSCKAPSASGTYQKPQINRGILRWGHSIIRSVLPHEPIKSTSSKNSCEDAKGINENCDVFFFLTPKIIFFT